ncbi:MAG: enoyl-CoA hydratase [Propionibacterium sp.]|nr:enoyl-CoA hydratase [Propionibacterium sp.]
MTYDMVLIDDPAPQVRRITMNRPEKRNALNHTLRGEIVDALQRADMDDDIKVMILCGNGPSFSAGYDLQAGGYGDGSSIPGFTAPGEGAWPRHVTDAWMSIWDLSKPVIAQVHGYCLAGGSELATGCDLVYMADDAQMGYPAVRFGVPDMHFHPWLVGMRKAMEMYLTGDSINGIEATELGWATGHFPADNLAEEVLAMAERISRLPLELIRLHKRAVHRQMEVMGLRTGIRAGTELCALGTHTEALKDFMARAGADVTSALNRRDAGYGDYRTAGRAGNGDPS